MAEINVFNEGLSKRVDAQYLNSPQGRTVHNINLDKGTLKSRPLDKLSGFGERGLMPFWWRNSLFTNSEEAIFVEFDRRMFKNSGGAIFVSDYYPVMDPIQWSPVGLESPVGALNVNHLLWKGTITETESDSGTLTSPQERTEFLVVVDDIAYWVPHSFRSHTEPFYLDFTVPAGSLHKLYRDKGAGNYSFIDSSDDGTSLKYGYETTVGEAEVGQFEFAELDEVDVVTQVTDSQYSLGLKSLGATVSKVQGYSNQLGITLKTFQIEGLEAIKKPNLEFKIDFDCDAVEYEVLDTIFTTDENEYILRIITTEQIIDLKIFRNGEVAVGRARNKTMDYDENCKHLTANGIMYMFYRGEIELSYVDFEFDNVRYLTNNLNLSVQNEEYIADYWAFDGYLYGIISSGLNNRLYKRDSDWTLVTETEGLYWGNSANNNVNQLGMYLTFRESIKIYNGETLDFQKPQLEVPGPHYIEKMQYCLIGNDMTAFSKTPSPVSADKGYLFNINMRLEINVLSDLDKSNMLYGSYTYTAAYENEDGSQSDILSSSESIYVPMGHVRVVIPQTVIDGIPLNGQLILFRTMGIGGQYYEVFRWDEASVVVEYIDTTHDADLGLPPENVGGEPPVEGINYLTEHRGRLYGAENNRLYFSEYGDVHNWPPINYLVMPQLITGIASIANGLLVFSDTTITILLGSDIQDFQVRPVDKLVGCLDYRTMQPVKGGVFFMSYDGIYFCDGSNTKNISEDMLGNLAKIDSRINRHDITSSVFVSDEYVISMRDYFLSMDLARGTKFSTYGDNSYDKGGYASISTNAGIIYGHKGGVTYELSNSEEGLSLLEFKSGDMTEGLVTNLKEYDKLRVVFKGEFEINIYLDDKIVITKAIESKDKQLTMIGFNNNLNRGIQLKYSVVGVGTIYAMDFVIKGRSTNP